MYHLIHLVHGSDLATPVVRSQVFDRAHIQAITPGEDQPKSVSIWSIYPARFYFRECWNHTISRLRQDIHSSYPELHLKVCLGIGRFRYWPGISKFFKLRKALGKVPVVYHCRSEITAPWAMALQSLYPQDAIVIDVRGFAPMEELARRGIFHLSDASQRTKELYEQSCVTLAAQLLKAQHILTVSGPLKAKICDLIVSRIGVTVIPCCVESTFDDARREALREQYGLQGTTTLVYLGGTAFYQHLSDMVVPFMKAALDLSPKVMTVFLTQQPEAMKRLLETWKLDPRRTQVISLPKDQVGAMLTACDAGVLLRARSDLNQYSQPTKFGEYLAAGLPVIVEAGTGDIETLLAKEDLGAVVHLTGKDQPTIAAECNNALDWIEKNGSRARTITRSYVNRTYRWGVYVAQERALYQSSLLQRR